MPTTLVPCDTLYFIEEFDLAHGHDREGQPCIVMPICPNERVQEQVQRIIDGFDSLTCDAGKDCVVVGGVGIGWCIEEREHYAGDVMVQVFRQPVVVDSGTRAYLLCEDCSALPTPPEETS